MKTQPSENRNFQKEVGNKDYLNDLIGHFNIGSDKTRFNYNFRYNHDQSKIKNQYISLENESFLGLSTLSYLQERKDTNSILVDGSETLNLNYVSSKFLNYSRVNLSSTFDLIKSDPTEYILGYEYFDECFGVNIDFTRSFYADRDLKPEDILTILFSFKHLGSLMSSNLAVSETDKEEIEWTSGEKNYDKFF